MMGSICQHSLRCGDPTEKEEDKLEFLEKAEMMVFLPWVTEPWGILSL